MAKRKELPLAPIRSIMKSVGVQMASKAALVMMEDAAVDYIKKIARDALTFARHSKRVKVAREDLALALRM